VQINRTLALETADKAGEARFMDESPFSRVGKPLKMQGAENRGFRRPRADKAQGWVCRRSVVLLIISLLVGWGAAAAKELHPLGGGLTPETTTAKVGDVLEFALSIEPRAAYDRAMMTVSTSPGLALVSGVRRHAVVNLTPGEKIPFQFRVRVLALGPQELEVTLQVLGLPETEIVSQLYLAKVNRTPGPNYKTKTDKAGREFLEIEPD
jgi:hypothetical protein